MNIVFIVVVSLAIPLLWITTLTDRQSFNQAIKIREMITEILLSLAEWENGELTVFKLLTLKSYPENLVNHLRLIRGYTFVRLVVKLPRKRNVRTASAVLQQFYECVWAKCSGVPPPTTGSVLDRSELEKGLAAIADAFLSRVMAASEMSRSMKEGLLKDLSSWPLVLEGVAAHQSRLPNGKGPRPEED